MAHVFFALIRSFSSFSRPALWRYLVLPPLIGLVAWLVATVLWLGLLMDWMLAETPLSWMQGALVDWHLGWIASVLAFVGGWVLLLGGAYLLTIVVAGVWALPAISRLVAASEYRDVAPHGRDSLVQSIGVTLKATAGYLAGWIITLPIWLVPGMAIVHSFFWIAYLNRACFAYDAIAPLASDDEWATLRREHGGRLWSLAMMAAVMAHVPIIGFFAPALAATAFVHYGLQALRRRRGIGGDEGAGGSAIDGEFRREADPAGDLPRQSRADGPGSAA